MKALNIYERKTYTNRKTLLKYRKKKKQESIESLWNGYCRDRFGIVGHECMTDYAEHCLICSIVLGYFGAKACFKWPISILISVLSEWKSVTFSRAIAVYGMFASAFICPLFIESFNLVKQKDTSSGTQEDSVFNATHFLFFSIHNYLWPNSMSNRFACSSSSASLVHLIIPDTQPNALAK